MTICKGYMKVTDKEGDTIRKAIDKFQSKGQVARIMGYSSPRGNSSTINNILNGVSKQIREDAYNRLVCKMEGLKC